MSKTSSCLNPSNSKNNNLSVETRALFLKTKLFIPPTLSKHIVRPRLIELINGGLDKPLILVSAPAGYGKSTLISNWLNQTDIPSTWLSLDDGDNDPIRFLQYLSTSLYKIAPMIGDELLNTLNGIQSRQFELFIGLLVNELASISTSAIIVLDDLHIIHSQIVLSLIAFLINHVPQKIHIVILTRTDPPFPLSRLRVCNQLLDVRADQLRFTQTEIAVFLNDSMGLTLSMNDLSALEARTEGWIAGLQLAALSMQGCKDIHSFVSAFTGSHHYIMDYLVEEVLKLQPEKAVTFLLQTSILDRLCGPLCESVVGSDITDSADGQSMLETFEGMNLFVIPLDDERRWYRYHHLFTDVLRKRLGQQFPHLLSDLHRRASHWYEQNGFISESIEQAIMAGDQDLAAQLIEQNGCSLLISGEVATLLNWADAIEFRSETRPWLAIQKAWALALIGDLDRVEPTLQIPEKLLSPLEPTVEVMTMLGTIAAARAHCANMQGDTRSAEEYARQALKELPDCSSISRSIRSVATLTLGDTSWINGNLAEAAHAYTQGIHISREAGNLHMVIIANSNLADVFMEQGQLHRAASIYTQSLQMAIRPDGQRSPLAGSIYFGLSRLSYEYDRLDEADQYVHQCINLCQQWGDIKLQAVACVMLARLEQVRGNSGRVQEAVQDAEQLASEYPLSSRRSIQAKSDWAHLYLAQGNLERLFQLIQKSGLKIEDEIPFQREPEYVILMRALLAQGDYNAVLALSERLFQQTNTSGRIGLAIETLILQAFAFQGKKDTEHALAALERALAMAQPEGYVRIFLDEGEPMTRLLCQVESRQVGAGYAAELLSKISKISTMTQPSMKLLTEPLTTREVEVLKLIEAGCSNQEISEQLVISITTVKRHISNIYAKLEVKSRTQALAIGKELKLFD